MSELLKLAERCERALTNKLAIRFAELRGQVRRTVLNAPDTDRVAVLTEALREARDAMKHCLDGALSLPRFAHDEMEASVAKIDAALSQPLGSQENGNG